MSTGIGSGSRVSTVSHPYTRFRIFTVTSIPSLCEDALILISSFLRNIGQLGMFSHKLVLGDARVIQLYQSGFTCSMNTSITNTLLLVCVRSRDDTRTQNKRTHACISVYIGIHLKFKSVITGLNGPGALWDELATKHS